MGLSEAESSEVWRAIAATGLHPDSCLLERSSIKGYDRQITHSSSGLALYGIKSTYPSHWHVLTYRTSKQGMGVPKALTDVTWASLVREAGLWAKGALTSEQSPGTRGIGPEALGAAYESPDNRLFTLAERAEITRQIRAIKTALKDDFKWCIVRTGHTVQPSEKISYTSGYDHQ